LFQTPNPKAGNPLKYRKVRMELALDDVKILFIVLRVIQFTNLFSTGARRTGVLS